PCCNALVDTGGVAVRDDGGLLADVFTRASVESPDRDDQEREHGQALVSIHGSLSDRNPRWLGARAVLCSPSRPRATPSGPCPIRRSGVGFAGAAGRPPDGRLAGSPP